MGSLAQYDLDDLIKKYNTPIFFETGTARGDGVIEALKHDFKKIISVEIDQQQTFVLKEMFKQNNNVEIINDNSAHALETLIKDIDENIIFWLDAHYPGADLKSNPGERIYAYTAEQNDDIRLPLEKELEIIKKYRAGKQDVILFDDIMIYKDNGNLMGDDANFLKPRQQFSSKEFYKEILRETHCFVLFSNDQGMLLPKI